MRSEVCGRGVFSQRRILTQSTPMTNECYFLSIIFELRSDKQLVQGAFLCLAPPPLKGGGMSLGPQEEHVMFARLG